MNKQKNIDENKAEDKEPEPEFEEIEGADFFRFEKIGDSVEGMVIDKDESRQYGFGLYTIKKADGDDIRFHGSEDLDPKMANIQLHDYIRVTYTENTPTQYETDMKIFKVERKKE